MELVIAAALGVGLGVVTGMPLGVINVAIVDAAAAGNRRYAIGIGIGGALADMIHAALAFIGVGQLVTARPEIVRVLAFAAAALIVGYAILSWRRPREKHTIDTKPRGIATGFLLTLPNPGALSAWVAVASLWPVATSAEAIVLAVGVGIGSAAWFTLLARLIGRLPPTHRALQIIPRVAVITLVGIAIIGVVRVI